MLNQYTESVLIFLGVNAVLALSLYLPVSAGLLSLGQGGFMAIGCYVLAPWSVAVVTRAAPPESPTSTSTRSRAGWRCR